MNSMSMFINGGPTPARMGAASDAFTDLRWITVRTAPRHYPS